VRSHMKSPPLNERGMALVIALVVLVVLSIMSLAFIMSITSGKRNASYDAQAARALNVADAGIAEAMERIRRGEVPNTMDPKDVAQIFLIDEGSVPTLGADSLALGTHQPVGEWLTYSSATPGPEVLTVAYKTDAARTVVYRYDSTKNPAVQTVSGQPIYVITATGRYGNSRRKVVAEVVNRSVGVNLKAALTSQKKISLKALNLNGYDHRADTPSQTGNNGARIPAWETGAAALPGAWSGKKIKTDGTLIGVPTKLENQKNFYQGVWEVLNMTQDEFDGWIGEPNGDKKQGNPRGITYVEHTGGKKHDGKGKFEWKGGFNGDGILYVNGDLKIKGDFTFRGLIYVNGKFEVEGAAWFLGGVVAKEVNVKGKKGSEKVVLRSDDSISQNISKAGGLFATLSWREIRD